MFVIYIARNGVVIFEEWADQDFETALCPPREMKDVSENNALQLWLWLAQGAIETVRSRPWETAT